MKKSIQLNLLTWVVAGLFLTMQNNIISAASVEVLKIESINQTGDPMQGNVNTSRSNIKNLSLSIDAFGKQLRSTDPEKGQPVKVVRLEKVIKTLSMALDNFERSDPKKKISAISAIRKADAALDNSIKELYKSIVGKYATEANDIKAKYDAVKSSISNIK
ncbi:MAG: hypothetical protein IPG21_03985 [Saprospiraceae bacterium]|nr:hypothetical protein [Candidatus Vicinibacter affinis]